MLKTNNHLCSKSSPKLLNLYEVRFRKQKVAMKRKSRSHCKRELVDLKNIKENQPLCQAYKNIKLNSIQGSNRQLPIKRKLCKIHLTPMGAVRFSDQLSLF